MWILSRNQGEVRFWVTNFPWREGGLSNMNNLRLGSKLLGFYGTPLQYSCLENPMDRGVHGVAKSRTRLSDFTLTFHFHALEEEMATHSTVLAWRIPWTEEPGGLPSMGLHRVRHNWSDLAAVAAAESESRVSKINNKITQAEE